MIILNKSIDDIQDILKNIPDTDECSFVYNYIENMIIQIARGTEQKYSYKDFVEYALNECKKEIPSPFSSLYPNCYGLNLGNDFFTIRIPNKFGFGIRVVPTKKALKYELSLVFYNNKLFVENSDYYKELLEAGWKVKENERK